MFQVPSRQKSLDTFIQVVIPSLRYLLGLLIENIASIHSTLYEFIYIQNFRFHLKSEFYQITWIATKIGISYMIILSSAKGRYLSVEKHNEIR